MKKLSPTVTALPVSAATAVDMLVRRRRAEGRDVVSFCVGEPDFPTPVDIAEAGIAAIRAGETKYTDPAGTPELRQAVSGYYLRQYGLCYEPQQVVVTDGAKYAVCAAAGAMAVPGDEFILPTPCWPSFDPIVRMWQGVPVHAAGERRSGGKLTPDALRRAVSEKSKALIINNPCNPTGAVYTAGELAELMEVCREYDLYVIADEVYGALTYDGLRFTPCAALSEDARERTVTVGGASKSYAMTGWRLGWGCANPELARAMAVLVNHSTGSPCSVAQSAALCALRGDGSVTETMRRAYERRRDILLPALRRLGLVCAEAQGAFYILSDVSAFAPDGESFARELMDGWDVAVVPGRDFGAPECVRFAYTLSEERMAEGLRRLEEYLKEKR